MNDLIHDKQNIPWKRYAILTAEVWIAFCIATFSMGVYFTHLENHPGIFFFGIVMGVCYLFVIITCIKRIIDQVSIAGLMLIIPIAPLAILLLVISLLPIIQTLR